MVVWTIGQSESAYEAMERIANYCGIDDDMLDVRNGKLCLSMPKEIAASKGLRE